MDSRVKHYAHLAPVGVMRYSGLYLIRPESVPDHIASCTSLALMIYKDLKKLDIEVNLERLIYKISIHDLPESLTSDIVRPLKYHHEALLNEFRIAEQDMLERSGLVPEIIGDINNAKDASLEGKLLAIIDILQCIVKLSEESQDLNNRLVDVELDKCKNLYHEKIESLFKGSPIHKYLKSLILN